VAGQRKGVRAGRGGTIQPRFAPASADDAGGAEQPGVLHGQEAGHPGDAQDQHRAELPALGLAGCQRQPGCHAGVDARGDGLGLRLVRQCEPHPVR
jgi:hypothetical protein